MGKLATLAGLALTAMLWAGTANADLAKPQGQVVLTIGGAVSESNLDALKFFTASFLKSLEYGYDKAAGFDIAMLEALGTVRKSIKAEPWPAPASSRAVLTPLLTPATLEETSSVPCEACCAFEAISRTAAVCSSTAAAIVVEISST